MAMNKVLGSFKPDNLFAANQEFPAVADNLLIAAGQFLKRGSLVTKDGVLVDANDAEVYAVLAKDCDTTDGAQEAAVYLTGEFNIDEVKVNENVDNMFAVNVSARRTGIFLKPHSKMPPVAPMTLRFKFSNEGYSPVTAGVGTSGTWKQVLSSPNIWDWTRTANSWGNAFKNAFYASDNEVSIINAGDTSGVTAIHSLFQGCRSLKKVCLFDTSNVTTFSNTFATCTGLKTVPLFDTSKVTNISSMFSGCFGLKTVPLFDTSKVTGMSSMFRNCTSLQSVPLFDTSKVTDMSNMFNGSTALKTVPLFDISEVTNILSMFSGCSGLKTVPLFDTSKLTNMSDMFNGCSVLQSIPLFDVSSVTNVRRMFKNCRNVESGAKALYDKLVLREISSTNHTECFTNCGIDTPTGAAELALIPSSWGGLGE